MYVLVLDDLDLDLPSWRYLERERRLATYVDVDRERNVERTSKSRS